MTVEAGEAKTSNLDVSVAGTWVILACLSLCWLAGTYFSARSDISVSELPIVAVYVLAILCTEIAILAAFRRFLPVVFAVLGAVNTFTLYGVFVPVFARLPLGISAILFVPIGFLYFVSFNILRQRPRALKAAIALAPVCLVAVAASGYALAALDAAGSGSERDPRVADIRFSRTPNIYFLSFDAMLPQSLAQKYVGVSRPAYLDTIDEFEGRLIRNVFSDAVPTKEALSSMLKLRPNLSRDFDSIVTGEERSLLRDIFAANGYSTSFTFPYAYFGLQKGPFVDHYSYREGYSLCSLLTGRDRRLGLFGYCQLLDREWLPAPTLMYDGSFDEFTAAQTKAVAESADGRPKFYMEHVLFPSHTPKEYDGSAAALESYDYGARSVRAAEILGPKLAEIRAHDPGAIIFLYGDHGAWTSRPISFEDDPAFYVQDRHGTIAALFNADDCLPFVEPPGQRFQTIARIASSLIQCLAIGHPDLPGDFDFGTIWQISQSERFDSYVYE
jgi:hypothetical protein